MMAGNERKTGARVVEVRNKKRRGNRIRKRTGEEEK